VNDALRICVDWTSGAERWKRPGPYISSCCNLFLTAQKLPSCVTGDDGSEDEVPQNLGTVVAFSSQLRELCLSSSPHLLLNRPYGIAFIK